MPTERQIAKMVEPHGFIQHNAPGFVGFHRTHSDGRHQELHVIWWSNKKVAGEHGIPRSYLTICPAIDCPKWQDYAGHHEDGRFVIPLVEWPSEEQPTRPWADVAEQFVRDFMPVFDLPLHEARLLVPGLNSLYEMLS